MSKERSFTEAEASRESILRQIEDGTALNAIFDAAYRELMDYKNSLGFHMGSKEDIDGTTRRDMEDAERRLLTIEGELSSLKKKLEDK